MRARSREQLLTALLLCLPLLLIAAVHIQQRFPILAAALPPATFAPMIGGLAVLSFFCLCYYCFSDVRTYHICLPVLLICSTIRLAQLGLHQPPHFHTRAIILGSFYLGQLAFFVHCNQVFRLNIHRYTLRAIGSIFLLLYAGLFAIPQEIYQLYFSRIFPFAAVMSILIVVYHFYEKLRQKKAYILNAGIQCTCFEFSVCIDLFCAGGHLGQPFLLASFGFMLLFFLSFLWSYGKTVSSLYQDNEHVVKMQSEVTQANIRLLLSQIRPHFLYNTLNAVCALCRTDPALAEKAIVQFSKYLKSNMKAIEKTEPVRFEEELVHIKSYLWIEQLRLDSRLQVVWDLQERDFFIPLLSVEPLVENAIRHGISKQLEGGTLTIRTYKDYYNYYVQVIDDGVGFADGEISQYHYQQLQSTGIKNVASRLEIMMHGELRIESRKGIGTTATIVLPVDENDAGPFEVIYRTRTGELIRCIL